MLTVKVDPHTHTIASIHAFGTIGENARCAHQQGLEAIGMTDHFGASFIAQRDGKPDFTTTYNMAALPKVIEGVRVLAGAEVDIVDHQGRLYCHDTPFIFDDHITALERLLTSRDLAIASFHGFKGAWDGTAVQHTDMYCGALSTPGIHIIGHPGRAGLAFDIDTVLGVAKAAGKMIEINEHSFHFEGKHLKVCRQIAERCAELEVSIVVSSDAHSPYTVGVFDNALRMLDEIHFPQALIANRSLEALTDTVRHANERDGFVSKP